jgi:hypothetical protein
LNSLWNGLCIQIRREQDGDRKTDGFHDELNNNNALQIARGESNFLEKTTRSFR